MDFIPKVKNMDEPVNKETGEENPNFIYSDEEDFETYEDEVEAKSESFIPQAKAKTIQDDIFEEDHDVPPPKPKKEGKKTKSGKERKPMSEEHKEKLKQAREKAFLVKKQKAEERKKLKEQDAEEKNLLKLKKQKDIEKLKKEVLGGDKEEPKPQAPPVPVREIIRHEVPTLTKEDLEKAQLNAIMSYEKLRLARKEEKKKKQQEDAEMDRLRDKLMKAKNPNNRFSMNGGFF
jgi:hypothetical protein